ncbi:MAG: metalloregulator ArsR/SmtB family transcription factor [Bacteroidota bacterium]
MRLKHFNIEPGPRFSEPVPTRRGLRILNLILANGEMCITDLEQILEFTQTKTSRHLIYLKNSGILTTRKFNQWVFYQIKDEVTEIIQQIFHFFVATRCFKKTSRYSKRCTTIAELTLKQAQDQTDGQ